MPMADFVTGAMGIGPFGHGAMGSPSRRPSGNRLGGPTGRLRRPRPLAGSATAVLRIGASLSFVAAAAACSLFGPQYDPNAFRYVPETVGVVSSVDSTAATYTLTNGQSLKIAPDDWLSNAT